MGTQGTGRKRSTNKDRSTAEDDALNLIAREAEARLAAKRAARAEAREIRMKELERQQKEKYYGLNPREEQADSKWGDIEQWMEDSERFSRSSRLHTLSDDDERMSVGSRGSVRGSSLHRKSKKKKKHKHRDSSRLSDDSRMSRSSRLDLRPSSFTSSDLLELSGPCRNPGLSFNGYQSSLYDDGVSLCSGSRRVSTSHPVEYSSYRSSRASSRASSARTSPVENCGSVASFVRSAVSGSALSRHLDDITIPDFPEVEDRDFDKGPRAASVGGTSSRRGSGETALTLDADGSIREIKEIHELKDQIQDVETKYQQNLKEAKEALAEVEEKYRKAMVSNAQLDNEKSNLMYQVDTLKDSLMELEELLSESRRQFDDKLKEFERQKHAHSILQFQFDELKETLKQSEELLNEIRQLRLKQDGYVREISDLQETVEWKDKKIGALERQKEYSDAIRMERDELREEAVKLRDILKKHGIVLGPDLNINGDAGPSEVDGSAGAEPRPAQESQPAPAEGNGVLGSTEELRACREEDVAPEQQDETLEDVKESHDEQAPEAQTCFRSEESHLDGQITVDPIDRPDPKAKAVIIVSQDLQQIQTSGETETSEVDSISHSGLTETQSTGTEVAGGDLSGGQESKQEVVTTEPLAKQAVPVGPNSEPQQEPEEAENDEAEETVSKSQAQVSTASGKKKKRKKKGKKKGGTHENKDQEKAGTEKQNEKTRKDSVVQNNGPTAEQDTRGSAAKPQDNQEPEKVKHPEPSENVSSKENLQEPNTDPGSKGHNQEKTTNAKMLEGADVLGSSQVPRLGVETIDDMQSEECDDPEEPNEGSAVEALNESEMTGPDQEGNLVTCKSKDDPDSSGDASGLQRSATDHVSGDAGETGNTEMLEQSETVGSSETSCHTGTRAELPEGEQNKETSPTAGEAAEPPEGFLQDEPLEESVPESNMAEGDTRETNLPSNEGNEGPNKHLPSYDDSATTPAFQEPNNDHVSGDQEEETLTSEMLEEANVVESPETPDEEIVEVLQNQEETSEPEKHESVLQTTETSQAETIKGPNEPETAEDVKEMESETGSDRVANLLTSGKSEDPEEAFLPDSSSPDDVAVVQNVHTESESVDGDEKMIKSIVELAGEEHDGVPESGTGSEINEETSASSANDDAREQPETSSTSNSPKPSMREPEEAAEPDDGQPSETSEEICQLDEELNRGRGQPENPPLHMNDEVKLANLTKAETGDTGSPPKEEQTSAERPEPEHCPSTEEVNSSQRPLAEQVKDSMEEPDGNDSPPHVQLDRDEDDGEEDEGQSFDFDDSDVEAAVASGLSNKLEQEDVEEGAEVNGKSPELCQSNVETKTEDEEEKVSEDDDSQVDQSSTQNDLRCGDNTPEKVENVPENIEQKTSSTVEEGLDATEVPSDPQKTPEQTDGTKEVLQAGKDPKKKKGKGKSKEDCKMS